MINRFPRDSNLCRVLSNLSNIQKEELETMCVCDSCEITHSINRQMPGGEGGCRKGASENESAH